MKLLLDTHVIIWAITDDERLSTDARTIILDRNNIIYYSLVSMWEIAIKNFKNPKKCPYNEIKIANYCDKAGYEAVNISLSHISQLRKLRIMTEKELNNNDPFDRLLLAQAKTEGMLLLTHDCNFDNYNEPCIMKI